MMVSGLNLFKNTISVEKVTRDKMMSYKIQTRPHRVWEKRK